MPDHTAPRPDFAAFLRIWLPAITEQQVAMVSTVAETYCKFLDQAAAHVERTGAAVNRVVADRSQLLPTVMAIVDSGVQALDASFRTVLAAPRQYADKVNNLRTARSSSASPDQANASGEGDSSDSVGKTV